MDFEVFLRPHVQAFGVTLVKKGVSKIDGKRGAPPESNKYLFPCQEALGQAATIKNCSSTNNCSDTSWSNCSSFCLRMWIGLNSKSNIVRFFWNVDWAENCFQNRTLVPKWNLKNCLNCCTYYNKKLIIWHALGKDPANLDPLQGFHLLTKSRSADKVGTGFECSRLQAESFEGSSARKLQTVA